MSMQWDKDKKQYTWIGSARDLVATVGGRDARLGFVIDGVSGAKISMNISGSDDPDAKEPFYIESPDGENLYDASNRLEAVRILLNIRKGISNPDQGAASPPRARREKGPRKSAPKSSMTSLRRVL